MDLKILTILVHMLFTVSGVKLFLDERCGKKIQMDDSELSWVRLKPSKRLYYEPNMDCIVTIETERHKRLSVVFIAVDIEFEPHCGDDYLLLYDGNTTDSQLIPGLTHKICGEVIPKGSFVTTYHVLTMRFRTDSWSNENGFNVVVTSFHEGHCNPSEHKCDNGRCIYNSLVNDGINHCGDNSDELEISREAIWGVVGGVIIISIIGVCIAITKRRRKRMASRSEKSGIKDSKKVWQPEKISPPEGRKRPNTLPTVSESEPPTPYPGIMENSENISLELQNSESSGQLCCTSSCHTNMGFNETEDDPNENMRTKYDRSLSSMW